MASLAPTIDPQCQPARSARTSQKNRATVLSQSGESTAPKSFHLFSCHAQTGTPAPQLPYMWRRSVLIRARGRYIGAVRFSDNFIQPFIKCLNSTRAGCVGFLGGGTLLKYPQTLTLIGQNFVSVCVRTFFPP